MLNNDDLDAFISFADFSFQFHDKERLREDFPLKIFLKSREFPRKGGTQYPDFSEF